MLLTYYINYVHIIPINILADDPISTTTQSHLHKTNQTRIFMLGNVNILLPIIFIRTGKILSDDCAKNCFLNYYLL